MQQERLYAEFSASRQKGEVDRACRLWGMALAENAGLRRFAVDEFLLAGLAFARDGFQRIDDERLRSRTALWIFTLVVTLRPGDPECERWEKTALTLARKAGAVLDTLAIGVVACTRRVWHGVAPGDLSCLKHRLDSLASLDASKGRPALAWLAARTHLDLIYESGEPGAAHARLLADAFEHAARAGNDLSASPLGSAELVRYLFSGRIEEARAVLHRVAPLTHQLAPYDAWMFWFYKAWLGVAAEDAETAMLESSRALGFAHQCGVPHAVFWAKLVVARAFAMAPPGSGVWRRLAEARREARSLGLVSLIALCRLAAAVVAVARGRGFRATLLGAAALRAIEMSRMLRPPAFTSRDFELIFRNVESEEAPGLRSLYSARAAGEAPKRSPAVHVRCLGAFSLERDGRVIGWSRKVPRRPLDLLKFTIAHGRTGVSVAQATDALWSGMDGDRAHRAFATALYRLRGVVGDDALDLSAGRLSLNRTRVLVDAYEFEDAAASCGSGDVTRDRGVLALYAGVFLPEHLEDSWAAAARNRLRELFRTAMRKTVERLLDGGHWRDALELLEDALKRDSLAEIFYQRAIAACFAGGLRAEASGYYERCRGALSEHLGVSPSARTEALYRDGLRVAG